MAKTKHSVFQDPFSLIPRIATKVYTLWLKWTYPFISIGKDLSFHFSCEIKRSVASHTQIGSSVIFDRGVWLNIPEAPGTDEPVIIVEDGCKIGRHVQISAKNCVHMERGIAVAGHTLITDHNHAFEDVTLPIVEQGTTAGGTVRIEQGCWIGFGVAIVCSKGELVIGQHSVIGSNSVVTRSIPPYSVVSGNPARIVKQFDPSKETWGLGARTLIGQSHGD